MRLALGASGTRLVRQFLTESLLLAAIGGSLGVLLAYRAGDLLVKGFQHLTVDTTPDIRLLGFTAGVTLLTGVLIGLAPAIRATRVDVQPGLRRDSVSSGFAQVLVVVQLALSLVALVGAGLFTRTLHNLRAMDLGMNVHNLTVFRLLPAAAGYTAEQDADFARRALLRLQQIQGVESVALSRSVPLQGSGGSVALEVHGIADSNKVSVDIVTPGFFGTMGLSVLLGRGIEDRDGAGAPKIAIVNETLARTYFPNQSPIGKHLRTRTQEYEIAGVVADGKYNGLRTAISPTFFVSYPQSPANYVVFAVEVRTVGNPSSAAGAIRRAIDPNVPIFEMKTEEQVVDGLLSQDRLFAFLSAIFGALAVILAAIGLFSVRAYAVECRTAEIGIRMALGADRGRIVRMILGETGWLTLFGVLTGIAAAYSLTRYFQSMLYGIAIRDLATFALAAILLTVVAALAGYLPRAAQVDPMVALRHE